MLFSVIIPARNEEVNIARCIESLMKGDWDPADFEVIVVDNGSTDRTVSLASELGAKVMSLPDATISALRNLGAHGAQGEILAFIDADCTVSGNWLREAARYINQDDVVCFGSPPGTPENATWVQQAWFLIRGKEGTTSDVDWLESMNMFVRRREFLSIGGFDEGLITCEDYDLSLRLKEIGRVVSDERIVAIHHGEAASVGHFLRKEYWRGTSNIAGIRAHGISFKELPSVALPIIYGVLTVGVPIMLVAWLMTMNGVLLMIAIVLILAWQVPMLLMAAWKSRSFFRLIQTLQLYLLLNIYFLARGGAAFRCRHKDNND
jgi:glycosyltransferase involved in cell wall biosynthesis